MDIAPQGVLELAQFNGVSEIYPRPTHSNENLRILVRKIS